MTLAAMKPEVLPAHSFALRVYYEDTDAGGVVYYANYLNFAERARTEMLRDAGLHHNSMKDVQDVLLVVRRCAAEYLRSAKLDDLLDVQTRVTGLGAATIDLHQSIRRGAEELCTVTVTIACVSGDGRPVRMPAAMRQILSLTLPEQK